MQTVVIDARAHMLGRLASIVAKQILNGHHVVSSLSDRQRPAAAAVAGDDGVWLPCQTVAVQLQGRLQLMSLLSSVVFDCERAIAGSGALRGYFGVWWPGAPKGQV
jgi:hypothetical protein